MVGNTWRKIHGLRSQKKPEARLCYRVTLRELFCHLPGEIAYDKDLLSGGGGG